MRDIVHISFGILLFCSAISIVIGLVYLMKANKELKIPEIDIDQSEIRKNLLISGRLVFIGASLGIIFDIVFHLTDK